MKTLLLLIGIIIVTRIIPNKKIACAILFSYLWILFAYSYGNADYYNYEYQYSLYANPGYFEFRNIGFKYLCKISNCIGLTYQQFLMIEATVILGITFFVILRLSPYPWEVTFLYIIYSFFIDTVQVRNCLSRSIVIFGLYIYIHYKKNIKGYLGMGSCIILGSLIHVSSFGYLIFLLLPLLERKYVKIWISGIVIFGFILYKNFFGIASLVTTSSNINEYLSKNVSIFYILFVIFYIFWNYYIIYLCNKKIKRIENVNESYLILIDVVLKVSTLLLIFVPLACVASDFLRIFRLSTFMTYIVVSNLHNTCKKRTLIYSKKIVNNWILLCRTSLLLIAIISNYIFITSPYMNTVVIPLFENNLLLH